MPVRIVHPHRPAEDNDRAGFHQRRQRLPHVGMNGAVLYPQFCEVIGIGPERHLRIILNDNQHASPAFGILLTQFHEFGKSSSCKACEY